MKKMAPMTIAAKDEIIGINLEPPKKPKNCGNSTLR